MTKKSDFRAYEIYLERGEQEGNDLDDWLQPNVKLNADCFRGSRRASQGNPDYSGLRHEDSLSYQRAAKTLG